MMFLGRRLFAIALALLATPVLAQAPTPGIPNVAAASDLKFALDEIAKAYEGETGRKVQLTYGSSGNFFQQIRQGAPFQMFMSADEGFVRQLNEAGRTVDEGTLYAIGRIVLFAPKASVLKPDAAMTDLRAAIADGRITRFAIANPEHAPYGRAAEEALRSQGMWDDLKPKLVLGENVSQAAQFATTGNSQGGIFAYSLALAPAVSSLGTYALIPADWHAPLRQRMALVKGAGPEASAFYAYIQQPAARTVFRRYGFLLPAESS
ncbi:MAG: molybdate ABC transporter substrate-binding protein [Bosea sp.]|jgi:molybdate transport system substrate-binding protein|nr:molybdate ABC transporter substrate-binding protein [Bosea sp. (in: a-proteobacteria)]